MRLKLKQVSLMKDETAKFNIINSILISIIFSGKNGEYTLNLKNKFNHQILSLCAKHLSINTDRKIIWKIEGQNFNKNTNSKTKAIIGTVMSYIKNSVLAVRKNFEKKMSLLGNEYSFKLNKNNDLILDIGFSHLLLVKKFKNIDWKIENDILTFYGKDKMLVSQAREVVYNLKPLNPYKAKGFHKTETIMKFKERKTATKTE